MNQIQSTDVAFILAAFLSLGFPLYAALTARRYKHHFERPPKYRRIVFWCVIWMLFVGFIGTTFEWWNGMIRYSGESLRLLKVQQDNSHVMEKEIQRTRGSGNRIRYWIITSTPSQERIRVSKVFYDSTTMDQSVPIAYTTWPKVYWPIADDFSVRRFENFLFCYSFIMFCSYGFFAFAWRPDRSLVDRDRKA